MHSKNDKVSAKQQQEQNELDTSGPYKCKRRKKGCEVTVTESGIMMARFHVSDNSHRYFAKKVPSKLEKQIRKAEEETGKKTDEEKKILEVAPRNNVPTPIVSQYLQPESNCIPIIAAVAASNTIAHVPIVRTSIRISELLN